MLVAGGVLLVALLPPLAYWQLGTQRVEAELHAKAAIKSDMLGRRIVQRPELWLFEQERMKELLSLYSGDAEDGIIRAANDMVITEVGPPLHRPVLEVAVPIYDAGVAVGSLTLRQSVRTLAIRSGVFALLSLILGAISYRFLILAPLNALERATRILTHAAYHDSLTGLPNRLLLRDRLEQAITTARSEGNPVALMFLDLDNFKVINDSVGHAAGDTLLKSVSDQILAAMRQGDTIARLGGDEFVVIATSFREISEIAEVAEKLLAAFRQPVMVGQREIHIGTSIGITVFPQDGEDSETLMKNADIAMYQAKAAGRNTFRFFNATMTARALQRLDLESSLRQALKRGEFELHYQPIIDLRTGRAVEIEALIRWRRPGIGTTLPRSFIPLAEETGLVTQIGNWVIEETCRQIAEWRDRGLAGLPVAINLSARQFDDADLAERIEKALADHRVVPTLLRIDLAESVVMNDTNRAVATLKRLRDSGVAAAIDDFGTGYSSLAYLKQLPIDTLKIDRTFVREIPTNKSDVEIVRAIVALAAALDIKAVAEGVETEEQQLCLIAMNCPLAQGYLYAKPMMADQMRRWLEEREYGGSAPGAGLAPNSVQ